MCTMTIVSLPAAVVRIAFNRDEQRSRAIGRPPEVHQVGSLRAVYPIDPPSGGTWLAVNDAGLMLAVLNASPRIALKRVASRSRGAIIPALLESESPANALQKFERSLDYHDYAPFRLVLLGDGLVTDVRWDGLQPMVSSRFLGSSPLLFTSSGLGDHLVENVRRALFHDMFNNLPEVWSIAQDAFHQHRWPGREHLSVNMERVDARTVSHSVITLTDREATFRYHSDAPHRPAQSTLLSIPFAGIGVP